MRIWNHFPSSVRSRTVRPVPVRHVAFDSAIWVERAAQMVRRVFLVSRDSALRTELLQDHAQKSSGSQTSNLHENKTINPLGATSVKQPNNRENSSIKLERYLCTDCLSLLFDPKRASTHSITFLCTNERETHTPFSFCRLTRSHQSNLAVRSLLVDGCPSPRQN